MGPREEEAGSGCSEGESLERSDEAAEKQGTKWPVPPQGPSRGKGKGRGTLGHLDLEPVLHLPDRMSVGTAAPVITGCGTGHALRK